MYVDTSITAAEGVPPDPAHLDLLSRFFKALSEPTRLRVVLALTEQCRPVSDIAEATGLPQPLVSHHLRILRDAGIAKPDRRGNHVYY
ncbi:MAG: ArsR/SmtB family transcription factor [Thermoleophilia bacterium]